MGSGLMGSLATGMAMGTGSAIAHRAVDSMMGPRGGHGGEQMQGAPDGSYQNVQQQEAAFDQPDYSQGQAQEQPCQQFNQFFMQCLQQNSN
mmetsp:Transcript_28489/g.20581  ORF Transcript_28489/g.20581 Transcript_28489/m.20581 type:complete len:91 (-) Transcript_28489:156-428(-)